MSEEFDFSTGMPSQEMQQYLQMYVDETSEQLEALVETLLVLETRPADAEQLNEAFRLIHSVKGSSAMMGLDGITMLTHRLENHFERLRSGLQLLDQKAMGLILRCIDFLRECNRRLREGVSLGSAPELLEELALLTSTAAPPPSAPASPTTSAVRAAAAVADAPPKAVSEFSETVSPRSDTNCRLRVQFEPELPLADLKAELVIERLKAIGRVVDTLPAASELQAVAETRCVQVLLATDRAADELRAQASVDGVQLVEVEEGVTTFGAAPAPAADKAVPEDSSPTDEAVGRLVEPPPEALAGSESSATGAGDRAESRSRVVETVRVDIDRLDALMNLAGELVVNKARFVQIARQMSPAFRKSSFGGRARSFGQSMRRVVDVLKAEAGNGRLYAGVGDLGELESEIESLEEQSRLWEESRRGFSQITEAIDQMTRVSDSLQRGVLDTRMVPVAPLFNRFKRVVRDISVELGKKVSLEIHGENTELDKRMIDELGDPLVHLVRNAIDHGIEQADVRVRRGKPEAGTVRLDARHSGNNVLISVTDDGGGIPVDKVRRRIVERGLAARAAADGFTEQEVLEYIWHPGFSTAEKVSDISGRGVGMDIVRTRIAELNGTIDIQHSEGRGTTFTIRLPLTLAIIRSLLFRTHRGIFAVPIDNVREIVAVPVAQILSIHGRRTFDIRGEFAPLIELDDIFDWNASADGGIAPPAGGGESTSRKRNVVILHSASRTMGLEVDELHGGQDLVIKSLAENFVSIRGLSGASILGDGTVCLLLDAAAVIAMAATEGRRGPQAPVGM